MGAANRPRDEPWATIREVIMQRILRMAGAVALALAMAGGLAACDPDDVAELALPTIKAGAVKLAIGAAKGETRSREALLSVASGYCEVSEADRQALREAFAVAGRPAFAVDCGVVAELRGRPAAAADPPMTPRMRPYAAIAAAADPHRRE